jgi:two-component system, NtrC family, sensor kinase
MKLARRFFLATLVGIFAVLSAYGALTFRRELSLFDQDSRRDQSALAHTVEPAFSRVWQLDGKHEALRLLERVNASETSVKASFSSSPSLPPGALSQVERTDAHGESYLVTRVPTHGGHGVIELRESTRPRSAYVRESMTFAALAGAGIFAWCAVIAGVLGLTLIGRPIRALVAQARAIGAGELGVHAQLERGDELGELSSEMNGMADRLEAGRKALAEETAERLRALNQLRHADRLATVGKLASGVAHELGTPLNVVLGRAKMIRTRADLPDDARRNAGIVEEQVERMSHIIRQLLDFARAGEAQHKQVDLSEVTRAVHTMLGPMAEKRGASLVLELPERPPAVSGDPAQLEQVLTNLVVNALQATTGPGQVTMRLAERRVVPPESRVAQEHALLEVEDQGAGMPEHVVTRVFEPFFTTKGVGEGTGLGLSVAYGMVRDHGGFMQVESEPGRGSRFSVFLPLGARPVSEAAAATTP